MAKCNGCEESFHACPSCGLIDWEWDFCSWKCYEIAAEKAREALRLILGDLSKEQKEYLKTWADDYFYCRTRAVEEYLDIYGT